MKTNLQQSHGMLGELHNVKQSWEDFFFFFGRTEAPLMGWQQRKNWLIQNFNGLALVMEFLSQKIEIVSQTLTSALQKFLIWIQI